MTMARVLLASTSVLLLVVAFAAADEPDDVGYAGLIEQDLTEVDNVPITMDGDGIPDWLDGTIYLNGPGRWEVGGMKFTHLLDGFSKLHAWSFRGGKVTFSARFPRTGALNQSIAENKIAFGVVAQETEPPRHNPGMVGFIKAPNDNNNVNTWLDGDSLTLLSDVPTLVNVNKDNLDFQNEIQATKFKNMSNPMMAPVNGGGSAHPHCDKDGTYISLRESDKPTMMGSERMSVYKVSSDKPDVIQDIVHFDVPRASYTHSFGLTNGMVGGDHAVVVAQPIYTNVGKLMKTANLKDAFETPAGAKTTIHILPMDNSLGNKQVEIDHEAFFFGHFINAFSRGPGKITFDLDYQAQVFFSRFSIDIQSDKAKRDSWAAEHGNAYSSPTRFEVDLATGTITLEKKLFPNIAQCGSKQWCEQDLFKLHPDDYGRDYCGYWAQQNYWNSTSYGAWATVRVDLCTPGGPKIAAHWYQRNVYPGEPTFVPKPGATDKTEGVVIFKVYEGETKLSKIVVADAKTLKTISTGVLPVHIPFTVHANYYATSQSGSCPGRSMSKVAMSPTYVV